MLSDNTRNAKRLILPVIRRVYRDWQAQGSPTPAPHLDGPRLQGLVLFHRGVTLPVRTLVSAGMSLCTDGKLTHYREGSIGFMPV